MPALRGRILRRPEQRIVGHAPVRRDPQRRLAGIVDPRRHDADDRRRFVVETGGLADDVGPPTEKPPPQSVAENRDARCVWLLVRCDERAADGGPDLEKVEEIRVHHGAFDTFRVVGRRQGRRCRFEGGQSTKRMIARAPIEKIRRRRVRKSLLRLPDVLRQQHEFGGARIWQRPEQDGVDDAEDRGVCADANGDCEYCQRHETRRAAKRPNRVPNVLTDGINHWYLSASTGAICAARRAGR